METLIKEVEIEICSDCKVEMRKDEEFYTCPMCKRHSYEIETLTAIKQTISRILLKG